MTKPSDLPIWNTTKANVVEPNQNHKDQGWLIPAGVPEKPPLQYFNHWQNNVYEWIEAVNNLGILNYDSVTDYVIGAFVLGSDTKLYQAKIVNGASSTPVDPVGDLTGTWVEYVEKPGIELIDTAIVTSVTSVEFDTGIDDTYHEYEIRMINVVRSGFLRLALRLSSNGGVSYISSANYDYAAFTHSVTPISNLYGGTGLTSYYLEGSPSADDTSCATLSIYKPSEASPTILKADSGSKERRTNSAGSLELSVAINAFQLFPSAGTISGEFRLYGIRKE